MIDEKEITDKISLIEKKRHSELTNYGDVINVV